MKLSSIVWLLLVSSLSGMASNLSSPGISDSLYIFYFSTVEFVETPLSKIKGSIPLSKQEAFTRNHYQFAYNARQQLVSVSFFNGNTPREPNHTANLFTLSHRMEFNYSAGVEKLTFYNKNQLQIPVLGNCYSLVYTHNKLGFRDGLYFLNKDGQRIVNSWEIYDYQWEYQADGSVIESRFDKAGNLVAIRPGFQFYRLRLYFNPLGHIALMQNIDGHGNLAENESGASQDRITTNAHGNFVEWNVLNNRNKLEKGNGPDVAIGKQQFNEYGYEITLEHQDEKGQIIASHYGICKSKTSFDKYGNIKTRAFYNEQDIPAVHQNAGYHSLVIEWGESGNRRKSIRYFDVENKPCVHQTRGYHSVHYEYDAQMRLIKMSYHAPSGELVNRKDNGRAYSVFTYNEYNERETVIHFDKDNQSLKS